MNKEASEFSPWQIPETAIGFLIMALGVNEHSGLLSALGFSLIFDGTTAGFAPRVLGLGKHKSA